MAWGAPQAQSTGTLITSTIWNGELVESLNFLLNGRLLDEHTTTADKTTSSGTFVDIDSSDSQLAIASCKTGRVLVGMSGVYEENSSGVVIDVRVDGSEIGNATNGLCRVDSAQAGERFFVGFVVPVTGLSDAPHTFHFVFKALSGTPSLEAGLRMWVWEL